MYDFPPLDAANDTLWLAISHRLAEAGFTDVPHRLDRSRPLTAIWRDPRLILAQTCGYPLVTSLAGKVIVVATPIYDLPGCDGPFYRSLIVVRRDDSTEDIEGFRGRRVAVNGRDSNSGMNLLRALIAPLAGRRPFFGAVRITGSHLASVAAVASGETDLASIDCVTYGQLARVHPERVAGLRVLTQSPPSPGLPLITTLSHTNTERDALIAVLEAVTADPALADTRSALRITGFVPMTFADYAPITALLDVAVAAGYETLA